MKIEEFINSLPENIISGESVQLPEKTFKEIFRFVKLDKDDIFYHLGCGDGLGNIIAKKKFNVKKSVGIDIDEKKISDAINNAKKDNIDCDFRAEDVQKSVFDDATIILFWFNDEKIIELMKKKFEYLPDGCRIITIWGPLPNCIPEKVQFPFIINKTPLKDAVDLSEQLLAVFGVKCIDFVTAWEYAERYTKAIGSPNAKNDRFVNIIQSLVIWINARNLGVSCENEIPESIKSYIGILKNYFNIEIEHLIKK